MTHKQKLIIAATATVFVWSTVMALMGHIAAVATLAPALGLTVQQIVNSARSHSEPAPAHPKEPVGDQEGRAS
ncbi:hypothetical protein EAO75_30215 [Streptomyces sp. uw30]|uniref:hypothetical protein n=1 Tax=Streptomyces sp. uw30 TaxID=1828179 RepID=UPI0011CE67F8|nr:hypothetical protein [Streptomyces sp. uw30]TXS44083.1 hypothetical protein EAO75_30215 [Streptomyces sp. uw30]